MIPFDIDPIGYYLCGICAVIFIFAIIAFILDSGDSKFYWGLIAILYAIAFGVCMLLFIISGSVYTDTITICKHDSASIMTVIDMNENVYYIQDVVTKFKVVNNETIRVKVKELRGSKIIYFIDAPIACGNQTCGVST